MLEVGLLVVVVLLGVVVLVGLLSVFDETEATSFELVGKEELSSVEVVVKLEESISLSASFLSPQAVNTKQSVTAKRIANNFFIIIPPENFIF